MLSTRPFDGHMCVPLSGHVRLAYGYRLTLDFHFDHLQEPRYLDRICQASLKCCGVIANKPATYAVCSTHPTYILFEGISIKDGDDDAYLRLEIRVFGFSIGTTLASFVHWTSLSFDGPLASNKFHDLIPWKDANLRANEDECGTTDWTFIDRLAVMDDGDRHIGKILRGLQEMAIDESYKEHGDSWSLAAHVLTWLTGYTTGSKGASRSTLESKRSEDRALQ